MYQMAMVLLLFIIVVLFDGLTLLKKVSKRTKVVYAFSMLLSFGVLMLHSLNVKVPSPTDAIRNVVEVLFSPSP